MRIEVREPSGQQFMMDSTSPDLVGRWFADMVPLVMSANASYGDWYLRIWPMGDAEYEMMRAATLRSTIESRFNAEQFAELAELTKRWVDDNAR